MRADLGALTAATLAELTNRGLVKRAARELERDTPKLSEDADGTVHAVFPDGTVTDLPPGGLEAGTCSCGATGICRHVIGLVLAYTPWSEGPPADGSGAAPGEAPATTAPGGDALMTGTDSNADAAGTDSGPNANPNGSKADTGGDSGKGRAVGHGGKGSAVGDGDRAGAAGDSGTGNAVGDSDKAGAVGHGDKAGAAGDGDKAGAAGDGDKAGAAGDSGMGNAGRDGGVGNSGGGDRDGASAGHSSGEALDPAAGSGGLGSWAVAGGAATATARGGVAGGRPGRMGAGSGEAGAGGWSPGAFTDEQLTARVGARMMAAARRVLRAGYVARVHRGRVSDPVPTVELPTATVRFLVPHDLGFARSDAVAGSRDDVLALAVWAFRAADEQGAGEADVQVQVGGAPAGQTGVEGLDRAVALAGTVVREGAVHLGAGMGGEIAAVRAGLEAARMRWPLGAVDDLAEQLTAYRERSARYRPEALADHVAELVARYRSVTRGGASLASRVLGTDEASETPLRRARLDGLGARVSAVGDERTVDVFLAHADSSAVLVLRRRYVTDESGPELGRRRVAGVTLGALAGGAVITESAARSASRAVRLGTRRLSRTEAMTTRDTWQHLPGSLLVPDLAGLAVELDALPPRPIRARVEAELVRVVPIAEVRSVTYAPGAQRVDAEIADGNGVTARVSAVHAACAPGRLDAVVAALEGGARFVAGSVRRSGGTVVIDPIGFASGDGVVVPDLAEGGGVGDPRDRLGEVTDPLGRAVVDALELLAEVAHRGLLHLPSSMGGRLRGAAERLETVGLRQAGAAVSALVARLGPDPGDEAFEVWADAYLRVGLCAELLP
ncbi:hypothetical protein [Actinoplanes sp. NPDC048796]|uniref:hypothetical protein n=1 Tax=Actinoplanes sp. NPDC048796 TaxID=3155640 RepID=UPI0033FAC78D